MSTITAEFTAAGALSALRAGGLSLLQYPATELEAGPCQLWLRPRGEDVVPHPVTGPASGSSVGHRAVAGRFGDLGYDAWWDAVGDGFAWQWRVTNTGGDPVTFDVVLTQDVALTAWGELRRNEYYVSQYLDLTPIDALGGTALAVRQNMPDSGHPWLALASLTGTAGWATDALQLCHAAGGLDLRRDLPGRRVQHEHTLAALQAPAVTLAPGESARGGFVGVFVASHPAASGPDDTVVVERYAAAGGWRAEPPVGAGTPAVATLFAPARVLDAAHVGLPDDIDGRPPALVEHGPDGVGWSAFAGDAHVVTLAKEHAVLRPHGHVMHHGPGATAGEGHLASTAWMAGVFASQLTLGHASAAPHLTLRRSYLGLSGAGGVRVAVRRGRGWELLGQPSLWVQRPRACTWEYITDDLAVTVRSELGAGGVRLEVTCDPPADVLVAVAEDHAGVRVVPEVGEITDDRALFADGRSRGLRWTCVLAEEVPRVGLELVPVGALAPATPHPWRLPSLALDAPGVAEVDATLAWFAHDAAVHFQVPRGLEQFTGGAWGTRDVCQGPVGLLLATGEHGALRDTLLAVFAGQQDDGDWPQWFDFLDAAPGHRESHGDVVYWPLLALGEYLLATGDRDILDEPVRWVGTDGFGTPTPLSHHVELAVARLRGRRTRDPRLPAYGHGDWNDSLQPAQPELAEQTCSAWTSILEVEALRTLAAGLGPGEWASDLVDQAGQTEAALREVLLVDGELAGYVILADQGAQLVVHPHDTRTGLAHGSLQVIHALSAELLSPTQAAAHVAMVDADLQAPPGIYLFDVPVAYHGGVMHTFKRAEAASFWGREVGLMYTHAHLRWVEALTHLGDAERAWAELLRVVPVGLSSRHPGARPRQSTCYYSSAEAAFPDRYEASRRAGAMFDPTTPVEGGWRVYSSGPGLVLRLLTERLLGVRFRAAGVEVDPVLPASMDGLVARVPLPIDGFVEVTYHVGPAGHGVHGVTVDGAPVAGQPLAARYRAGGVRVPAGAITADARVEVWLG